jgi:hypothetical protein
MTQDEVRQEAVRMIVALIRDADDLLIGVPEDDREAVHEAVEAILDRIELEKGW